MKTKSSPIENVLYEDIEHRGLIINKIDVGNYSGREIQGYLYIDDIKESRKNYSCTLKMWEEIWRDKAPRVNPEKMKIG